MLRSNLRRYVNRISERFQGASPAELYFYLRYWAKAKRLAKEMGESIDPSRLREVIDRNVDIGDNPPGDVPESAVSAYIVRGNHR